MELSGNPSRNIHHQSRRSEPQNRHRRHRVAQTIQAHGSDHSGNLAVGPARDEYAHEGDKHGLVSIWLEEIETPHLQPLRNKKSPAKEPGQRTHSRPESTYRPRSQSPSKLFSYDSRNGRVFRVSPRQRLRGHKRPRDLVQRSPVLDLCEEQEPVHAQPESRPGRVATESNHDSSKERSLVGSEGSVVSAISGTEERFVKKARHKTKTDRYETKDRKPRKPGKKKRKGPGDQGKTYENRRGGDFSSAREVMDNFNSKSILNDLITMQPTVKPGLFDNGRASKDQLPDLTFHEMHFLKRPLPSKLIPRDRERAKRRGKRELEEASAFFLHKGTPEVSGASGQDHPPVSGASSLDKATCGSSAFSIEAPPRRSGPSKEYGHRSPEMDTESSHAALAPGTTQAARSRGQVSARTPTPSPSRNAIRRAKPLDSTGVGCVERSRQVSSATAHLKNIRSPRAPLAVVSPGIFNRQPDMTGQNIRIVRYHDRGVMANEEAESTAESCEKGTEAPSGAVEQPRVDLAAESPASVNVVKCGRFGPEDGRVIIPHGNGQVCEATGFHTADHDSGPDRPRSPKCTLIERLEAAVQNAESRELHSDMARRFPSLLVQQDGLAASAQYSHNIPGAHSPCQDGCFELEPHCVGDRHQDHLDAVDESEDFYTIDRELRDSQRAHEATMAPQMASRQSVNSHRVSIFDQPAHGVRSAHRGPFVAHSMARSILGNPSTVQMGSPHRDPGSPTGIHDWATSGHGQLLNAQFIYRTHSVLPDAAEISSWRSDRQRSLEKYIAQMENEVFCRPQDAADDDSPKTDWHATQDEHGFYRETVPQALELDDDAYDQDLSGGGQLKDGSIGGSHYGGGSAMQDDEVDQEEQRFLSTFWRPNCY